jgi:hypothetical protein
MWFHLKREAPIMKIRLLAPAALVALCFAAPAFAAGDETNSQQAENDDSKSQVVCQVQRVTGSRLAAKRVCLTREQWADQRRQQRQDLQRAQGARQGPDITG